MNARRPILPRRRRATVACLAAIAAVLCAPEPGAVAQSTDPSVVGQWSGVQTWPIVAVHTHLLPTGKVMFYPYSDDPRLWDPATGGITSLTRVGYNIFCTGHSFLANGNLFVTGGHVRNNVGLNDASTYNPSTNSWTRHADMYAGRWYPTNTALANGDVLVVTGDADVGVNADMPQVWQAATGTWRDLTTARLVQPLYARMFLAPDGRVFFAGQTSRYLDTSGTGSWSTVATRLVSGRDNYGSAAMYDTGKVLWAGGADPPTATCEVIDLNSSTPAWRAVGSMATPRRQNNLTILPDGKVLVTGGSSASGFDTASGAVLFAELWDPETEAWTRMASYTQYRGYHSTALLLPDGRVLSAGGDNHPNAEVYSPPYLFKGARPTISSAPSSVGYGQTFFVGTAEATSIAKASWIRLGSVTHSNNMEQRYQTLTFSQASGGLNVTAPSSANHSPPGPYMLFLVDGNGVPSAAKIILIGGSAPPPPPSGPNAPSNLTATAVSTSQINLAWQDNAGDEAGFKIEQSRDNASWSQIAVVGANVTSYANTGLRKNTLYYYRVRAYNANGDSAYSNTASARTLRR